MLSTSGMWEIPKERVYRQVMDKVMQEIWGTKNIMVGCNTINEQTYISSDRKDYGTVHGVYEIWIREKAGRWRTSNWFFVSVCIGDYKYFV